MSSFKLKMRGSGLARGLSSGVVDDQVYAHTDRRLGARDIEDVSALLGVGQVAYTEWWRPIDWAALPMIGALAQHQEQRFGRAADERQQTV